MGADAVEAVNGAATSAAGPVTDAEILAELATLGAEKPAEKPAEKVEPEAEAKAVEPPVDDPEEQPETDDAETEDEDADPKAAKGLEQVRRAEQRWRAEQAKEREAFEKERAAHAEDVKLAREMKSMRDKRDLVAIARAMGMSDREYAEAALALHAETEDGRKDPRYAAKVQQSAKERAQAQEIAELRERLDKQDAERREASERAETEKRVAKYVDGVAKAATPKLAPITASLLTKRPEKTRRDLLRVAGDLFGETGEQPTAADVIKAYESELRELGITAPQVAATKPVGKPAASKPAAATSSGRVTDDELLSELASGKFS
jgi:hypothetical protein